MKRVGEQVGQVKHTPGVPDLFTYLIHLTSRRRCAQQGHQGDYTCTHCGLIQRRAW